MGKASAATSADDLKLILAVDRPIAHRGDVRPCPQELARAARRTDCGGWPKARIKARRIRSGSRKPVACATCSIARLEDCTCCRATSIRRRSTAFDGVVPVAAMKARGKGRGL